jgi:hypothetical protein
MAFGTMVDVNCERFGNRILCNARRCLLYHVRRFYYRSSAYCSDLLQESCRGEGQKLTRLPLPIYCVISTIPVGDAITTRTINTFDDSPIERLRDN